MWLEERERGEDGRAILERSLFHSPPQPTTQPLQEALVRRYIIRLLHTALLALRASHADGGSEEEEGGLQGGMGGTGSTAGLLGRLVDGAVKVRIRGEEEKRACARVVPFMYAPASTPLILCLLSRLLRLFTYIHPYNR